MILDHALREPARLISLVDAAANGQMAELRAKLCMCTDVHIDSEQDSTGGSTPVHWAALNGQTEALRLLLQCGGQPNAMNKYGVTPVQGAVGNGHTEALRVLLEYGGDPDAASDLGRNPVYLAANNRHLEALALLEASRSIIISNLSLFGAGVGASS